jgi:hypothetical protein
VLLCVWELVGVEAYLHRSFMGVELVRKYHNGRF